MGEREIQGEFKKTVDAVVGEVRELGEVRREFKEGVSKLSGFAAMLLGIPIGLFALIRGYSEPLAHFAAISSLVIVAIGLLAAFKKKQRQSWEQDRRDHSGHAEIMQLPPPITFVDPQSAKRLPKLPLARK